MGSSHLIFFGTYTKTTSRGIYAARLDDASGALTAPTLVAETASPTWIALTPDKRFLYAVHASAAQAIGYAVDSVNAKLTPLPRSANAAAAGIAPCHLSVDATGRALVSANYHGGYLSSLAIHADGTLGAPTDIHHSGHGPNPDRQEKPHVHSVNISPDNRFVIVCDLGVDKLFTYALDAANAKLSPGTPPFTTAEPGSGPRHLRFSPDGRRAYNITEMGATVVAYDYDAARGALSPIQTVSTLPLDFKGQKWAAEVRVHPNGKFLYASNRGHDSIAVFAIDQGTGRLTPIEIVPTGGKVPRNFSLSPNAKWLVCGHQESENITVFSVDGTTGRLTRTPHTINVPMCVCVVFY